MTTRGYAGALAAAALLLTAGPASAQSALRAEIVERVERPCAEATARHLGMSEEEYAAWLDRPANRRIQEDNIRLMEGMLLRQPRSEHDGFYAMFLQSCLDGLAEPEQRR